MIGVKNGFASFSVDDLSLAKKFYGQTLGVKVEEDDKMGLLTLHLPGGARVMVYPKPNHVPAHFTVLNFIVSNIDQAVDELAAQGVSFEKYGPEFKQDAKGIARSQDPAMGPDIAWFKDPAGNILSIIQDER